MQIKPVVLEDDKLRLEPLATHHKDGLIKAINDGKLWTLPTTFVPHPDDFDGFVADAQTMLANNAGLAFVSVDKSTNSIVGSTRFMEANLAHGRIEIGFTFLAQSAQRTHLNTHAKLLMLSHAFEVFNCNRVELKTDYLNHKSRAAIVRLGAKEEGVLRNHMLMKSGRVRDSAVYSIIKNEWAGIKECLFLMG